MATRHVQTLTQASTTTRTKVQTASSPQICAAAMGEIYQVGAMGYYYLWVWFTFSLKTCPLTNAVNSYCGLFAAVYGMGQGRRGASFWRCEWFLGGGMTRSIADERNQFRKDFFASVDSLFSAPERPSRKKEWLRREDNWGEHASEDKCQNIVIVYQNHMKSLYNRSGTMTAEEDFHMLYSLIPQATTTSLAAKLPTNQTASRAGKSIIREPRFTRKWMIHQDDEGWPAILFSSFLLFEQTGS